MIGSERLRDARELIVDLRQRDVPPLACIGIEVELIVQCQLSGREADRDPRLAVSSI